MHARSYVLIEPCCRSWIYYVRFVNLPGLMVSAIACSGFNSQGIIRSAPTIPEKWIEPLTSAEWLSDEVLYYACSDVLAIAK
jgi:hypothetical protein